MQDKSLNELIAEEISLNGTDYALGVLKAFKEGDSGAIKLVMQAIEEAKYREENKFVITDERFKEIILIAADQLREF